MPCCAQDALTARSAPFLNFLAAQFTIAACTAHCCQAPTPAAVPAAVPLVQAALPGSGKRAADAHNCSPLLTTAHCVVPVCRSAWTPPTRRAAWTSSRCTPATRSLTTSSTSRRLRCAHPGSAVSAGAGGALVCGREGGVCWGFGRQTTGRQRAGRQKTGKLGSCCGWPADGGLLLPRPILGSRLTHTPFSPALPCPRLPAAGADLANLLNEAAILTGRRNKTGISQREIDDSIDRIVAGEPTLLALCWGLGEGWLLLWADPASGQTSCIACLPPRPAGAH
jgi:hypothetical protein